MDVYTNPTQRSTTIEKTKVEQQYHKSTLITYSEKEPVYHLVPADFVVLIATASRRFLDDKLVFPREFILSLLANKVSAEVAYCCGDGSNYKIEIVEYECPIGEEDEVASALCIKHPIRNNPAKEVKGYDPSVDQVDSLETPVIWKQLQ